MKTVFAIAVAAIVSLPVVAPAQRAATDPAPTGSVAPAEAFPSGGGPLEALFGALANITGSIFRELPPQQAPGFQEYVAREQRPSYAHSQEIAVGTQLPARGVTTYAVPKEYGVREYRYTRVNNRTVLVDPKTRRIVQIID